MPTFNDVAAFLQPFGLKAIAFSTPTPTSQAAAAVIGCSVGEIAKTILLSVGKQTVAVVAAGDARVNNSLLKSATGFGGKVRMLANDLVLELSGYPPGGVCPFLLPSELPLLLDQSLHRFDNIYPAAGTPASGVCVPTGLLTELTGGKWATVCRIAEEQ